MEVSQIELSDKLREQREKLLDLSNRNSLINFIFCKDSKWQSYLNVNNNISNDLIDLLNRNEKIELITNLNNSEKYIDHINISYENDKKKYSKILKESKLIIDEKEPLFSKICEKLYRKNQLELSEVGQNSLCLSLGFLKWYQEDKKNKFKEIHSPLILIRIGFTKERSSKGFKYFIKGEDFDVKVNICLIKKMTREYGLDFPELIFDEEGNPNLSDFKIALNKSIKIKNQESQSPDWQIIDLYTINNYSFKNISNFIDTDYFNEDGYSWELNPINKKGMSNLICGTPFSGYENLGEDIKSQDYEEYNKEFNNVPKLIFDADNTQYNVISKALEGKNIIVQGPPGTGKSQTITNIISSLLANNKKILFVSQKRAALEVVRNRLDNKGLADYILDVHSKSKGEVIDNIKKRMDIKKIDFIDEKYIDLFEELKQLRVKILDNHNLMNKRYEIDGEKIYLKEILWKYIKNKLDYKDKNHLRCFENIKEIESNNLSFSNLKFVSSLFEDFHTNCTEMKKLKLYNFVSENVIPNDEKELNDFISIGNKTSDKIISMLRDLKVKKIKWENLLKIENESLNEKIMILDNIFKTNISRETIINNKCEKQILKIYNILIEREEKELFLDNWIKPNIENHSLLKDLITVLEELKEKFSENDNLKNLKSFKNNVEKINIELKGIFRNEKREIKELMKDISLKEYMSIKKIKDYYQKERINKDILNKLIRLAFNNELNLLKKYIKALKIEKIYKKILIKNNINPKKVKDLGGEIFNISKFDLKNKKPFSFLFNNEFKKARKLWQKISNKEIPKDLLLINQYSLCEKYIKVLFNKKSLDELQINFEELDYLISNKINLKNFKKVFDDINKDFNSEEEFFVKLNSLHDFIFYDINKNQNEFEVIKVLENLKLNESLNITQRIISLFKLKLKSFGEIINENILDLDHKNLYLIINDLKDYNITISKLKHEFSSHKIFIGEDLEFRTTSIEIENILKLFRKLLTNNKLYYICQFENLSLINSYKILKNHLDQKYIQEEIYKQIENSEILSLLKFNYNKKVLTKIYDIKLYEIINVLNIIKKIEKYLPFFLNYKKNKMILNNYFSESNINFIIDNLFNSCIPSDIILEEILFCKIFNYLPLDEIINKYNGQFINQLIEKFCNLDKEFLEDTSKYIYNKIYVPKEECLVKEANLGRSPKKFTEGTLIIHETKKTKRYLSLRLLFKQAFRSLTNLHPCIMMSPASAAKYLPKRTDIFDVLIIDEASQMKPEQALSLIARCKQFIIVGDQCQLPPSTRFEVDYNNEHYYNEESDTENSESILELADKVIGFRNNLSLAWHYRSRHRSLIDFSNSNFYKSKLTILSSNEIDSKVIYKYVENSAYLNGINFPEAKIVIKSLMEQIDSDKNKSIIIATMNQSQAEVLTAELEKKRLINNKLNNYISKFENTLDRLEVKKLEDIQGDERDIVIISTVYGPDKEGKIMQNFGDINSICGHRRLNVLFSRAKHKIILVSSLKSIDIKHSKNEGPQVLKKYLECAEQKLYCAVNINPIDKEEKIFAKAIELSLLEKGYEIDSQIGGGENIIDLAIKHPKFKNKYILGIKCDGDKNYEFYSARSNYRLQKEVMEDKGWKIIRIWSADWFSDPIYQLNKIENLIKNILNDKRIKSY